MFPLSRQSATSSLKWERMISRDHRGWLIFNQSSEPCSLCTPKAQGLHHLTPFWVLQYKLAAHLPTAKVILQLSWTLKSVTTCPFAFQLPKSCHSCLFSFLIFFLNAFCYFRGISEGGSKCTWLLSIIFTISVNSFKVQIVIFPECCGPTTISFVTLKNTNF